MPLRVGDTFFMDDTGATKHLVGSLVPATKKRNVIVVPMVSDKPHTDKTCLIEVGEHEFVKHPTCMAYGFTKLLSADKIEAEVESGSIELQEPVKGELLIRIQKGLINSAETPGFALLEAAPLKAWLRANDYL